MRAMRCAMTCCLRWRSIFRAFAMPWRGPRSTRRPRSVCSTNWRVVDMQAAADDAGRALSRDALLALDDERALNLLRFWMRSLGLPAASTARLTDALRQLREVGEDHSLRVDHAGQALRSYRGQIYWEAGDSAEPADETALVARAVSQLAWQGESIWRLPQWRGTFVFAEASAGRSRRRACRASACGAAYARARAAAASVCATARRVRAARSKTCSRSRACRHGSGTCRCFTRATRCCSCRCSA